MGEYGGGWEECAFNTSCARDCMTEYLDYDRRQDCGRQAPEERTCLDYGIIYTFGVDACSRRLSKESDIKLYEKWMNDECNVMDKKDQGKIITHTTNIRITYNISGLKIDLLDAPLLFCDKGMI